MSWAAPPPPISAPGGGEVGQFPEAAEPAIGCLSRAGWLVLHPSLSGGGSPFGRAPFGSFLFLCGRLMGEEPVRAFPDLGSDAEMGRQPRARLEG